MCRGSKQGVQEGCRVTRSSVGVRNWESAGRRAAQVAAWGYGLTCVKHPGLGRLGKRAGRREESIQSPGKGGQGGYRPELGVLQGSSEMIVRYGWGGRPRIRTAPQLNCRTEGTSGRLAVLAWDGKELRVRSQVHGKSQETVMHSPAIMTVSTLQHRCLLFCRPGPSGVQIAWTCWRRRQHPPSPGILCLDSKKH